MTRRKFIVWWMTGLLTAFAVVVVVPLLIFIWPYAEGRVKNVAVHITLDTALDDIKPTSPVQFNAPSGLALKMVTGGGDNYPGKVSFGGYMVNVNGHLTSYSITCPHLGCSYAWQSAQSLFVCPCHGSEFELNGSVAHGPAEAPLSLYNFTRGSNPKEVIIDGYQIIGAG
jgi:cytochrome b6-f complex iron-sulfur subunit